MKLGIYTLANDTVYDQLVAFLNSVEANYSKDIPICVIPFNDNTELVEKEVARRKNVYLFADLNAIQKWETFISSFNKLYEEYPLVGVNKKQTEVLPMHRKYCAFDGEFDKFIFFDVDTLVLQPLDRIFSKLDEYEFVVHDYQRKTSMRLGEVNYYFEAFQGMYESIEVLANRFHCGGFWASKRGVINEKDLEYFIEELAKGDIKIFRTWLSEQTKLNYMTVKKNVKLYNFTLDENSEYHTGVCVTSTHFEDKNHVLYDRGRRLTYLHYMGIKNERFRRLCQWRKMNLPNNNILMRLTDKLLKWQIGNIPYKDLFLYYRFMGDRSIT